MIFPQEKPLDMYNSFLTKILETLTGIPAKNFLSESQNIHTRNIFFPKCMFFLKKKSFLLLECRFDNPDEKFPPNYRRYFSRSPKQFAESNVLPETFSLESVQLVQQNVA